MAKPPVYSEEFGAPRAERLLWRAGFGPTPGQAAGQAGGMIGETGGPDDQGNLKPAADFRGVHAALIEQWLGADAARVIHNAAQFRRPRLLR